MARPVIASRTGALPEVVLHEKTGLLVDNEDSAAFAEAILRLLKDPPLAGEMGRQARIRAVKTFGWETFVDAYDSLYRRVSSANTVEAVVQEKATESMTQKGK